MTIVFLEPYATGHRMRYLGNLVREAIRRDHHVVIGTTPEAYSSGAFGEFIGFQADVKLVVSNLKCAARKKRLSQIEAYKWCRNTASRIASDQQIDLVFIPYLNYIDKVTALKGSPFRNIPWAGIAMKESFHHHRVGLKPDAQQYSTIREKLFLRLLSRKHLVSVATIDETLPDYVKDLGTSSSRLEYVPDPVDINQQLGKDVACKRLGLSPQRFYLLCYGHFDNRKGVLELLDAIRDCNNLDDVTVIIAGRREPAFADAIKSRCDLRVTGPEVLNLDYFVDTELEQSLFSVADAVWVGYVGHFGSSGILGQAAGAGVPVIACDVGLIGLTTRRHNLGICVDPSNCEVIRNAVTTLKNSRVVREACSAAGIKFSASRTASQFSSRILDMVEQKYASRAGARKISPQKQCHMTQAKPNVLIVLNHPIHYKSMLFEAMWRLRNDIHVLYVSSSSRIRNKKTDLTKEAYSASMAVDADFEDPAANLSIFRIINTIIKGRPKVVVAGGYHHLAFWVSAISAKLLGAKVVLWYESNEFDHKRVFRKELIKTIFLKMCDFAQVYGTSNKEYLMKLGLREDQISIKMAVVDVPRFKTLEPTIGSQRRRTLIYVGRLSEEKNLRNLIQGVAAVNREAPDEALALRIVGYGPQEAELKGLVAQLELAAYVEFCGSKSQEELKAIFAEGDALILPSTREPWGLTILEAMCAGLPVIGSDHCGCAKDVIRKENGWQFEANSLDSLCDALRSFQQAEVSQLVEMGAAGRKIGIEYDADNSARRTSSLFTQILGDERGLRKNDQSQTRLVLSR
jgi:glycosyltransferase involved in cell wall biosynthesis